MNSTLKSLVFWMVLVAIGVLVWNFSSKFQNNPQSISFSEFVSMVDSGGVASVDISGNEITGLDKTGGSFSTTTPVQYLSLIHI